MTEPQRFITFPANWDEKRDRAYFEERFGESDDFRVAIATHLNKAVADQNDLLDEVLGHFVANSEIAGLIGPALTPLEKIEWLTELVLDTEDRPNVRDRLLRNLAHCAWADHERRRLLLALRRPFAVVWVAPLCDVTDSIGASSQVLEESMICDFNNCNGNSSVVSPE